MRYLVLIFLLALSCSSPVIKPEKLIPEDTMSEIVAELVLNDQMGSLNPSGNMETQTIYILQQAGVQPKDFTESYKYYLATPGKLESIYEDAQTIIKDKDPAAEAYINKKLKESQANPALAR